MIAAQTSRPADLPLHHRHLSTLKIACDASINQCCCAVRHAALLDWSCSYFAVGHRGVFHTVSKWPSNITARRKSERICALRTQSPPPHSNVDIETGTSYYNCPAIWRFVSPTRRFRGHAICCSVVVIGVLYYYRRCRRGGALMLIIVLLSAVIKTHLS